MLQHILVPLDGVLQCVRLELAQAGLRVIALVRDMEWAQERPTKGGPGAVPDGGRLLPGRAKSGSGGAGGH
jgi:hypothetical protein